MICRKATCAMVMCVLSAAVHGCSLPETTRTSVVKDVELREKLSSEMLQVQPGDEVRWVNLRKLPAQVEIPSVTSDDISCQRGFSNWMGSFKDVARLKPNETVALCFKKPGTFNYTVRAETSLGGGMQVLPGTVSVGNAAAR